MEKINLVEILKDCPKGMELDCTMLDNVVFEKLDFSLSHHPIIIRRTDPNTTIALTKYGQYSNEEDYKCVIYPKGKTTWEGFIPPCKFKNGDIIYVKDNYNREWCSILSNYEDGKLYTYVDICIDSNTFYYSKSNVLIMYKDMIEYRLATEEEKQKLFDVIKAKGYKWNAKTKTLEKLIEPKFEVGDIVRLKSKPNYIYTIYCLAWDDNKKLAYKLLPKNDKHLILVSLNTQDDYELVPNKFDINTLVPFESKVLIRDNTQEKWFPAIWGFYDEDYTEYPYKLVGCISRFCIPYEGNEYLLGTNNECNEYYKTWEK